MDVHTPKKILIPVDGSDPSYRALALAAGQSQALGAALVVVNVIDATHYDAGHPGSLPAYLDFEKFLREGAKNTLAEAKEKVDAQCPGLNADYRILWGPIVRSLIEEIEQEGADMVIVGRTGKGFFGRLLEGSVSRGLATSSPVPVTIVP